MANKKTPLRELEKLAAQAVALAGGPHVCASCGHKWRFVGARNCGCPDDGGCSVPVYECEICGECDYGHNAEANERRAQCFDMVDY